MMSLKAQDCFHNLASSVWSVVKGTGGDEVGEVFGVVSDLK